MLRENNLVFNLLSYGHTVYQNQDITLNFDKKLTCIIKYDPENEGHDKIVIYNKMYTGASSSQFNDSMNKQVYSMSEMHNIVSFKSLVEEKIIN